MSHHIAQLVVVVVLPVALVVVSGLMAVYPMSHQVPELAIAGVGCCGCGGAEFCCVRSFWFFVGGGS